MMRRFPISSRVASTWHPDSPAAPVAAWGQMTATGSWMKNLGVADCMYPRRVVCMHDLIQRAAHCQVKLSGAQTHVWQ